MRRSPLLGIPLALWAGAAMGQASPKPTDFSALEKAFDSHLSSDDQLAWLKMLSSEPNHIGSPHDKSNAEWILAQYKKWGWDAQIETFQVLFPTPISRKIEMGDFKADLEEPPIPGDSSAKFTQPMLPPYLAYQGDGDVTAPLVYVNYGTEEDYKALARLGVSVKGKIAIARFGKVWRGVKPSLAAQHGAIGCIIFSDPADDGYAVEAPYPKGPMRPERGVQRGSVMDMMLYPGDPLTPGIGATEKAKRLTRETAGSIVKIPALPISYADAQVLLGAMDGQAVPEDWRGALPITYRVSGTTPVHLEVKSNWKLTPAYDVIAKIKGSEFPDQWIVRGNHFDGWVAGASDPLSGQVALLDEAKALGALLKTGWRPKRTIVYTSWDGEEPMLLGSTEWAEQHAEELRQKAVLYLNTDGNSRGFLNMGGTQDLGAFMTQVAGSVTDPETKTTVGARTRARLLTEADAPGASASIKASAKLASVPGSNLPIAPIGSGSDFTAFLDHLGISTLNLGFGGEAPGGGVYHSAYDTFEHHTKFSDPGLVYSKVLAQTVGHAVLRAADSSLPIQSPVDFATTVGQYTKKVEKLTEDQREAAERQKALLAGDDYTLAADPTKPYGNPVLLGSVPQIDFAPLDKAVATLEASAKAYQAAFDAKGSSLSGEDAEKVSNIMNSLTSTLLAQEGLPGRPWFKNLIYAPGRHIGYGVTTLPGITESITSENWSDAARYIDLTAKALNTYSAKLDEARQIIG